MTMRLNRAPIPSRRKMVRSFIFGKSHFRVVEVSRHKDSNPMKDGFETEKAGDYGYFKGGGWADAGNSSWRH